MRRNVATFLLLGVWGTSWVVRATPTQLGPSPVAYSTTRSEPRAVRPSFFVTEVIVEGESARSEGMRDALSARFGRLRHKLDVRSAGELRQALDHAALLQLLGDETEHLSKLSDYVDADRIVFGRVTTIGAVREVSVRVVDVREGSVEVAMARRLAGNVDDGMILAVLDALADRLVAWALTTYGDSAPSEAYERLAKQPVQRRAEPEKTLSVDSSPWSALGISGAVVAGAGLGLLGASGAMWGAGDPFDDVVALSCAAGGGALLVGGTALILFDGQE